MDFIPTIDQSLPRNTNAGGYLILARRVVNFASPWSKRKNFAISAFQIPFGYAVYTRSNALHCDSFLTGDYLAVFAVADEYRTGNLVNVNGEILPVEIG